MATTTTTHKTRRGELMATLGAKKVGPGLYAVRGYDVKMIREASGSKPGLWLISNAEDQLAEVPNLTAALEMISDWIERDAALAADAVSEVEVEVETVPAEVEIVDETPEPVAPTVDAESVDAEVQEDVEAPAPTPVPAPRKPTKPRAYKTRRSELLARLGAREINTAEYEVAGHQVMYVAPGVMPRNAGGRWRTTFMSSTGVITNWNLSLTAALEVVECRVNEALADGSKRIGESLDKSASVRQYVAMYPSSSTDVDLCELHAPGCADLTRTAKNTDPQVAVTLDITDEDAAMLVLDPDELGYDMHSVKVMPCAQHAPLVQSTNA